MKFILALLLSATISLPVSAQTAEPALSLVDQPAETEIRRWSLEAGVGALFAFAHARVAYRLPLLDDKLALFADYAPLEAEYDLFPGRFQTAMLGARYYLEPVSASSLYFALAIGASFNPTGAVHPKDSQRNTGFVPAVFPYLGVGIDYMFNQNWGMNTQVGISALIPRADVNLLFAF